LVQQSAERGTSKDGSDIVSGQSLQGALFWNDGDEPILGSLELQDVGGMASMLRSRSDLYANSSTLKGAFKQAVGGTILDAVVRSA
jgi:hypothetical protein